MSRSLTRRLRSFVLPVVIKRRWTKEDARAVLGRFEESGLTVREFAEREGIDRQRLDRWRAQIGRKAPAFVEIARAASAAPPIEVVLHSGRVLRVADGFGEETLRRLVEILDDGGGRC